MSLIGDERRIPNQYLKQQLTYLDKLDGNVDSISNRIANVRTWSYVTNKANWVENQDYWIERTKFLEDKLSDRLHEELTKSFIDKRASVLARGLKQDIKFDTQIINEEEVMINNEYIGSLKGLKLELDLKIGALDTDVKSLKKAARQNVGPEILKRIEQIINTGIIELKEDFKIYWKKFPIAKIYPGKDYLNPKVEVIIDEMIENLDKKRLQSYLTNWIEKTIFENLESLINLKFIKENNPDVRALAYHVYENNGVVKREEVIKLLSKLDQSQRKILRTQGLRFGRYHIFLYKLFKPNSVKLRILLWKNFHQKFYKLSPPTFGLNFVEKTKNVDRKFMLLCGFEYFEKYYVRIDILERLFIKIIDSVDKNTNEIKLVPEMLNLLGCSKENFLYLIKKMNYKTFEKDNNTYFKYAPKKINRKVKVKNKNNDNPFNVLNQLNLK